MNTGSIEKFSLESAQPEKSRTDMELIADVHAGNSDIFGTLFSRHINYVTGVAHRLAKEPADAEDLTAEAFFQVFGHVTKFKPVREGSFRAYISRSVVNLAHNLHSREARTTLMSFDEADESILARSDRSGDNTMESVHETVLRKARDEELRHLLIDLPEDRLRIIAYRFIEDLQFEVIAHRMNRTLNATKTIFRRTVIGLRNKIITNPDQYSLLHEMLDELEQKQSKPRRLNS